ncbi:MAG: hypothetical protein LBG46_06755 [Elusimicrobiota bacterium]|jgi:hypothetical protein|nr:hypothetical protein [Elusimicrobiota bacterium]
MGYAPVVHTVLNTKKLENLGWCAKVDLQEMFFRLFKSFTFQKKPPPLPLKIS